jgi:hypothetical protein
MTNLFTGMCVLISIAIKMCLRLIDVGQRGLKRNTTVLGKGKALNTIFYPWDFFLWLYYSSELDFSGKHACRILVGGKPLGSVGSFVRDRICYLLDLKC